MRKRIAGLSLTSKFIACISLSLLLVFTVMSELNLDSLERMSMSRGEAEAQIAGQQFGSEFQQKMVGYKLELDTLSLVLLQAKEKGTLSRQHVTEVLRGILQSSPELLAVYTAWEPNAFDGKDAAFASQPSHDATGRFVPYVARSGDGIVIEPIKGYDKEGAEGDFYMQPKASRKPFLVEPMEYEVAGQMHYVTSLIVPILDGSGRFLGILGIDFQMETIQTLAAAYSPMGGYVTMVSENGNYVAHSLRPELLGQPYGDSEGKKQLFAGLASGNAVEAYTRESDGTELFRMLSPLRLDGSDVFMYTEAVVPKASIMEAYNEAKTSVRLISTAGILVLGVILWLLTRWMMIRPIRSLAVSVNRMAEGDLTRQVEIHSRDEIGRLAADFNHMTSELRGMFRLVADLSMSVGATSQQLTASAEQTSAASETIARSIEQVAAGSDTQRRHTDETANALNEMAAGIRRVSESSEAVAASAQEVQAKTELGNNRIGQAGEQMALVRTTASEAVDLMERLGKRSGEIGGIVGMISEISSQTNLLALNAAIEAARAGEHGRGFAVVAAQIRKLADQTLEAADQIAGLIRSVQVETVQAAERMKQGASEMTQGERYVLECADMFRAVAAEMQRVNGQIQEVSAIAEEMNAGSEQVGESVQELTQLAVAAADSSQQVASASEEQLASMEEIASSAEAMSAMVQELLEKLSKFKI